MKSLLSTFLAFLLSTVNISCAQDTNESGLHKGEPITISNIVFTTIEGFVEVPENYSIPNSKKIKIPVFVIKSSSENPDEPIFWLDGGPGGSNLLSREKIISSNPIHLLANHDFVCIGYRGVDGSVNLSSKEVNDAMKGLDNHLLSDASLDNIEAKIKAYKNELASLKIDINQYNVVNVAKDIDFLKNTLGYKKINLLSVSYGTRVAMMYAYSFPANLQRTMMIGACPQGGFLVDPDQVQKYLEKYDALYASQKSKKYTGTITEAMEKSFATMPKKWANFTLDADKIKTGTINSLYTTGFAIMAFDFYFKAAYEKDYSGLFLLQKIYDVSRSGVVGDVYAKTVTAELNAKVAPTFERTKIRNTSAILGSNYSLLYAGTYSAWDLRPIAKEFQEVKDIQNETLVISGELDFRTPAENTEKLLMPILKKGKHIIIKNSSHLDIVKNVMGSPEFLKQYYDHGVADNSLLQNVKPLDFNPKNTVNKFKIWVMGVIK
nr:alpha/beta fold hydrolase [uncultured Flavobacterium sp.]